MCVRHAVKCLCVFVILCRRACVRGFVAGRGCVE